MEDYSKLIFDITRAGFELRFIPYSSFLFDTVTIELIRDHMHTSYVVSEKDLKDSRLEEEVYLYYIIKELFERADKCERWIDTDKGEEK